MRLVEKLVRLKVHSTQIHITKSCLRSGLGQFETNRAPVAHARFRRPKADVSPARGHFSAVRRITLVAEPNHRELTLPPVHIEARQAKEVSPRKMLPKPEYDLGAIGKRAVLVEWQTFPDQTVDPRFVERLAGELKVIGAQLNDDLFSFAVREAGAWLQPRRWRRRAIYRACHNVAGGFEGPLDDERHRASVGSWKAAGLPWRQG